MLEKTFFHSTKTEREKTMNAKKNKKYASLIAVLLILAIALPMIALPVAQGVIRTYTNYVYVMASPEIVGTGQTMMITAFSSEVPLQAATETQEQRGWVDMRIVVTLPDGTAKTFPIPLSDPIGSAYIFYTPTQIGTYRYQAFIPEQWKNTSSTAYQSANTQGHYLASQSVVNTFVVQAEPLPTWPNAPVPNDYWTRPLNTLNRDAYVLAGNWLGGAANQPIGTAGGTTTGYNPSTGPGSPHILWTKPYYVGGIMDDNFGNYGFQNYHYEGLTWSAIVIDGKIHYTPRYDAHSQKGWEIVDLYSGETLFLDYNATMPQFAQIYNYGSPNQYGGYAYMYRTQTGLGTNNGTVWEMLDAYTFNHITSIANVTSGGTAVYGEDGSILRYNLVNYGTTTSPQYSLTVWNSSAIPSMLAGVNIAGAAYATSSWQWRPEGTAGGGGVNMYSPQRDYNRVHNGATGFSLNVSIPSPYGPRNSIANQTGSIQAVREGEYIIIGTAGVNNENGVVPAYFMALSLVPGQEGKKLWESTLTPPFASLAGNVTVSLTGVYPEAGVIAYHATKLLTRYGFDMKTGQLLWTGAPEPAPNYYGMIATVDTTGKLLFSLQYGGVLQAYDLRTGKIVWNYTATMPSGEYLFPDFPSSIGAMSGDGKIFIGTGIHSPDQPLYRGNGLQCLNSSNGALLWNYPIYGVSMTAGNAGNNFVLADGRLIALSAYDNELYCFGKGPSATTVSAPQIAPSQGTSITLTGTVTDQTVSGRLNTNDKLDFALKGTPAISDADMNAWMQYKFENQGFPTNAKGVPVKLTAIDPNGNYQNIGTVTSDNAGNYGISWVPPVPGTYKITATFEGSESYGSSFGTTYLTVGPAAASPAVVVTPAPTDIATPTPTTPAQTNAPTPSPVVIPPTSGIPATTYISIVAAVVVIVAAAAALILRKRKNNNTKI